MNFDWEFHAMIVEKDQKGGIGNEKVGVVNGRY